MSELKFATKYLLKSIKKSLSDHPALWVVFGLLLLCSFISGPILTYLSTFLAGRLSLYITNSVKENL